MLHAVATFVLGGVLGYLGQRARLCFIGGMRDWVLVRDTYLLRGLFGFLGGALVGFGVFWLLSPALKTFPWFARGGMVFAKKWAAAGLKAAPSPWLPVPGDPISWSPSALAHLILAIAGGLGVGFLSVLAGGCPFRQHVMAAEGSRSAMAYLLGFALGAIAFHLWVAPLVRSLLG